MPHQFFVDPKYFLNKISKYDFKTRNLLLHLAINRVDLKQLTTNKKYILFQQKYESLNDINKLNEIWQQCNSNCRLEFSNYLRILLESYHSI